MDFTGERYVPNLDSPEISYEHWHRYLYATQFAEGKVVLDIACGEGYGSDLLAKNAKKVTGVDISEETISHAKKTYKKDNLEFLIGSVADVPIDGKGIFDLIVSFETIEHVCEEDQKKFMKEVKRLLKPNGVFICSTPDKKAYSDLSEYKNEFHVKEFYKEEYEDFLKGYFKNVDVFGQKIWTASYIWEKGIKNLKFREFGLEYGNGKFAPADGEKDFLYLVAVCSENEVGGESSILTDLSGTILRGKDELISGLDKHAKNLEAVIVDKDKHAKNLEAVIVDKDKHAKNLEAVIVDKDKHAKNLEAVIVDKDKHAKNLEAVIVDKDKHSKVLEKLIEDKDKCAKDLEIEIENYKNHIEKLEKLLNDNFKEQSQKLQGLQDRVCVISKKLDSVNNLKIVRFLKKVKLIKLY